MPRLSPLCPSQTCRAAEHAILSSNRCTRPLTGDSEGPPRRSAGGHAGLESLGEVFPPVHGPDPAVLGVVLCRPSAVSGGPRWKHSGPSSEPEPTGRCGPLPRGPGVWPPPSTRASGTRFREVPHLAARTGRIWPGGSDRRVGAPGTWVGGRPPGSGGGGRGRVSRPCGQGTARAPCGGESDGGRPSKRA